MIKFLGAILIISAFGFWGISKSERLRKRRDSLLLTVSSLTLLENEIDYSQKDIASALLSVGAVKGFPLFRDIASRLKSSSVYEAFSDALASSDICLSKPDTEILLEFSQNLGALSKDSQIGSIRHAKELLHAANAAASEDYKKYGKLYRNMGFLLGIAVCILLL